MTMKERIFLVKICLIARSLLSREGKKILQSVEISVLMKKRLNPLSIKNRLYTNGCKGRTTRVVFRTIKNCSKNDLPFFYVTLTACNAPDGSVLDEINKLAASLRIALLSPVRPALLGFENSMFIRIDRIPGMTRHASLQ